MKSLEGKVALVLGASKADNIGQAIARRFVEEGAKVVVSGRNQEAIEQFAAGSGNMLAIPCDITSKSDVEELVEGCISHFGGLDIAVNASGWAHASPFCEVSQEDLQKMVSIQFIGPFQFMQVVVDAMQRHGGGSIIQISSATATVLTENQFSYMGTKAGIDHVVRAVANQFGKDGIRANSISPALTESPMTEAVFKIPEIIELFRDCYPLGRLGSKEEIASAAVWLAQDDCFMTGHNLQVNGGLTLRAFPTAKQRQEAIEKSAAK